MGRPCMPDCAPLAAQNEVKLLLELLPKYLAHVEKHPHTLLVKFFGLYRVLPENGSKVASLCNFGTALQWDCLLLQHMIFGLGAWTDQEKSTS